MSLFISHHRTLISTQERHGASPPFSPEPRTTCRRADTPLPSLTDLGLEDDAAFASPPSRWRVLHRSLGMGASLLALVGVAEAGAAAKRSCVEGCKKQFGPGRNRGQCISACAKGGGTPPEPEVCGGFAHLPYPEGFTCVDDPNDDCDPTAGGRDCGGICWPTCGNTVCGDGEYCCNPSCGICAPIGGFCTQQACEG